MDTSVRYTPKTCKIRNPKFVFGQHHRARSRQEKKLARSQSVLVYWCTACNTNLRLLFFLASTGVLPARPTAAFLLFGTQRQNRPTICCHPQVKLSGRANIKKIRSRAYRTFTRTPGETLNTPPGDLCGPCFSCLLAHVFWPCMVLYKTTQHDMFFKFCKRLNNVSFKLMATLCFAAAH
jgi:hypothetical protein